MNNKKIYLPVNRKHISKAHDWAHAIGTDYWFTASAGIDVFAAVTTSGIELAEHGWTTTSLVNTAGSGADLGSASDVGTPVSVKTDLTGDLLESPAIFGTYPHMRAAADIAGMRDLPRFLIARFWGAGIAVGTGSESHAGWGFVEDGGGVDTAADHAAFIGSDGTNFVFNANAGTAQSMGVAADTTWREWAIVMAVTEGKAYAYLAPSWRSGSPPLGAANASLTLVTDEAPYSFGMHALTNDFALGITHIYYEW